MQDIGATSAGGGGRGFGSAGIGHDSGGRGKIETANTVFRFSFKDFDQLGKGFGRVRDTLKDFGGLLEYIKNHEGLAISLESIVSEESRNALEALGYMIKYTPPPNESASYQEFCVRNSARVTHDGFDVGEKDKTIGNAWRAAYESGVCHKSGVLDSCDGCTPGSSGANRARHGSNDGSTDGNSGAGSGCSSGDSLTANDYSCETFPRGNGGIESRISDSDSASSDSGSRFRITIAPPSSGDGGYLNRAAFSPDDVSSDGDIGRGGSSSDQATVKDTAESLPSPETRREAAFGARVLVLFDDGKRYWGTINNHATSAQDRSHPDGPWSVLFDDCTQERFRDDDKDFIVTDAPRLRRMTMAQQEFYLQHPNGIELLEHVKNLSVGPGAAARREKELSGRNGNNSGALSTPAAVSPAAVMKPKPRRAGAGAKSTARKHNRSPAPKRVCY